MLPGNAKRSGQIYSPFHDHVAIFHITETTNLVIIAIIQEVVSECVRLQELSPLAEQGRQLVLAAV